MEYLICLRNFYKNEFSIEEAEKIMRISKNIECENRMMNIFKNKDITSYKTHVLYEMRKGEEIIEKLVEVLKIDKDEIDEILGISLKKYKVLEILKEITNSKENSITEFVYKYFDEKDKEIFFYEYYVKLNSYCHFQVEDVPSRHFLVGSLDEINSPGENIDEFYFDKEFKVKLIVIEGMLKIVNELYNELNS